MSGGGVSFTEEMLGHAALGATSYRTGWTAGKAGGEGGTSLMFHLTIDTGPIDAFLAADRVTTWVTGWVGCPALGGDRLPVSRGVFELFAPTAEPGRTTMRYRLWFTADDGAPLTLVGFKDIGDDPGLDLWSDTTSLSTRILAGHVDEDGDRTAPERARGILVIPPLSFARQLTTFRGSPVATARFTTLFVATLARVFVGGRRARRRALTPRSRAVNHAADGPVAAPAPEVAGPWRPRDPVTGEPPPLPRSASPGELGFSPRPRVRWLAPTVLVAAAPNVGLSTVLGRFIDRREIQAMTPALAADPGDTDHRYVDLSDQPEVWIDYVADVGDGFDATATVASVVAGAIDLPAGDGAEDRTLPPGQLLVLGGDEVYPSATAREYEDRFVGPYRAMLPFSRERRLLLALPGNHDWYDGLTSFLRLFCQGRWVGGWRTVQQRSYFAVRLPGGWWLWGVDIALGNDLDKPQLDYFHAVARAVGEGEAIILCSSEPSWVKSAHDPEAYATLEFFEREVIGDSLGRLRLALTGDLHHYARYVGPESDHKITAGGGGAYLSSTHHLPRDLPLPPPASRDPGKRAPTTFVREAAYPEVDRSRRMGWGVLGRIHRNGGLWALWAAVYLAVAVTLSPGDDPSPTIVFGRAGVATVVVAAALVAALRSFAHVPGARGWLVGAAHTLAHVVVAGGAMLLAEQVVGAQGDRGDRWPVVGAVVAVGALVGPIVMALYLVAADRRGVNANELFAAQAIEDRKCFLRLVVCGDRSTAGGLGTAGAATVYPIEVDEIRRWRFAPTTPEERWFQPDRPVEPALVEPPIVVARTPSPTPGRTA